MRLLVLSFCFCLFWCPVYSQVQDSINPFLLKKILRSLSEDGGFFCYDAAFSETYECYQEKFEHIKIGISPLISSYFHHKKSKERVDYKLQLFSISDMFDKKRYLLYFDVEGSSGYYRIQGYRETDFHHFYYRVLRKYNSKGKILELTDEWVKSDNMFGELDFNCLIKGLKKKRPSSDCYISVNKEISSFSYIGASNDQYLDRIYSSFSDRPFEGFLPRKAPWSIFDIFLRYKY